MVNHGEASFISLINDRERTVLYLHPKHLIFFCLKLSQIYSPIKVERWLGDQGLRATFFYRRYIGIMLVLISRGYSAWWRALMLIDSLCLLHLKLWIIYSTFYSTWNVTSSKSRILWDEKFMFGTDLNQNVVGICIILRHVSRTFEYVRLIFYI